eukprot:6591332-Pyramimonas_sp.AAC.3
MLYICFFKLLESRPLSPEIAGSSLTTEGVVGRVNTEARLRVKRPRHARREGQACEARRYSDTSINCIQRVSS